MRVDSPHSSSAEASLIACCAVDDGLTLRKTRDSGITPAFFHVPRNAIIFEVQCRLGDRGIPPDAAAVAEELRASKQLAKVGGIPYITQTFDAVPTTARASYYASCVQDLYRRRLAIEAATRMVRALCDESHPIPEALSPVLEIAGEVQARASTKFPAPEDEPEESEIIPEVYPIIMDLLEPGDKMIVTSGSKSFKTWTLIQLGLCISEGVPWLGFPTQRRRVLFLNFEIKPRNFWRRVWRIRRALNLDKSADFIAWNLRGKGFSMDADAHELIQAAKRLDVGVIVLDPIYKLFGERNESSAGDMATLMALFDRVATETGAAIIFAHHFAKGSAAAKDSLDRASGSGVFARDPDCIFTLTRLDEAEGANTFAASVTLREFAPVPDFAVRREHPIMVRVEDVNVRNLHEPTKRTAKYSVEQVLHLLPDGGATAAEWQRLAKEQLGMGRSTFFDTYLPQAKKVARFVSGVWCRSDRSDRSDAVQSDHPDWSESGIKNTGLRTGPRVDGRAPGVAA